MRRIRIRSPRRFALGSGIALALGMLTGWAHGEAPATAGLDAIGAGDAEAPRAIAAARAPMIASCPRGFDKVVLAGHLTACSAPADLACGEGQASWPGERGCVAIGEACDAATPEGALRVGPGGFATIADAIAAATPGSVVLVSSGEHALPASIDRGVTIRGTCVGETRLVAASEGTVVSSHDVQLGSATLEGAVRVAPEGTLALEGIAAAGRVVVEGELAAHRSALGAADGPAVEARAGAHVGLDRVSIHASAGLALLGARATLHEVAIVATEGAAIDARRSHVDADVLVVRRESGEDAPFAIGLDRASSLDGRWVFASAPAHTEAVLAVDGGRASLRIARLDGGDHARIAVRDEGHASVEDALLYGADLGGSALRASSGAEVRLARIDVRRASDAAIAAEAAELVAEDVVISRSAPTRSEGEGAAGVAVSAGGHASLTRVRIDRQREHGFFATGAGSVLSIAEVEVTGTRPADCATSLAGCDAPPGGDALAVRSDASATVDGARLTGSRGCGVVVGGEASHVSLAHVEVRASRIGICADGARPGAITIGDDVVELENEQRLSRPPLDRVAMR